MRIQVFVGTVKGAFLYSSDESREEWTVEGPLLGGWKVSAVAPDGEGGYVLATSSYVYGAMVHRGKDLRSWEMVDAPPRYTEESGHKMKEIWTLAGGAGVLYAGVDEAGLFESRDAGRSWSEVQGLSQLPSRPSWFPGFGGLCAHHVLTAGPRVWTGISSVGVFESADGGATWEARNEGVPAQIEDEHFKDIGSCVHAIVADPADPDRMWRQDHVGMFRSTNGGRTWERAQAGLPSTFGFPLVRDTKSAALFSVPLASDELRYPAEGHLRVYRSLDDGDTWQANEAGLPDDSFHAVLRQALACDQLGEHEQGREGGVYLGNAGGEVFASDDLGRTFRRLPGSLPRILCVEAFVTAD
ncbi:MAG: sialidase family protein [Planctomycetota bacterium]|nr:sialidase family protein [Planctomycetota bacterium]